MHSCPALNFKLKKLLSILVFQDNFWWHGSIYNEPESLETVSNAGLQQGNLMFMFHDAAIPKYVFLSISMQHVLYHCMIFAFMI